VHVRLTCRERRNSADARSRRPGCETGSSAARYLDGIALLLLIVTVALLITPETYHHIVEIGRDTGRFHQLISRMPDYALLPFALSLGIALFIAGESIFGFSAELTAGAFCVLLTLGCWAPNICAGCEPVIKSGQPLHISGP